MSFAHASWSPAESTESPMIFTFRLSNSGLIFAMYPSSVVHTGVKSLGCENRTTHESSIHSWKLIGPSVVSAWKSGAVSPMVNAIESSSSLPQAVISQERRPMISLPAGGLERYRQGGRNGNAEARHFDVPRRLRRRAEHHAREPARRRRRVTARMDIWLEGVAAA